MAQGKKIKVDWTALPLGDVPDTQIARSLGCSASVVGVARKKMGIRDFKRRIDWSSIPLGKFPDIEISRRVGCGIQSVRRARRRLGIALTCVHKIDWKKEALSNEPTSILARRLGVSLDAVKHWRNKLAVQAVVYKRMCPCGAEIKTRRFRQKFCSGHCLKTHHRFTKYLGYTKELADCAVAVNALERSSKTKDTIK